MTGADYEHTASRMDIKRTGGSGDSVPVRRGPETDGRPLFVFYFLSNCATCKRKICTKTEYETISLGFIC
ncbi:hypothetical protein FOCC_FOCC000007 [Frankliniella occidentalis]|nr:hypothetical protein FOCC_FOCC000007 [Frankliniella occidentalis]